jgi:hypothetical protein
LLREWFIFYTKWRVWWYQRGNHIPYIQEEEQTTQWPKEKVQKYKQRSTYKTKDWATRSPLKTGGELRCSWRVTSSCSTSGTRRVYLVLKPVPISQPYHASSISYILIKWWSCPLCIMPTCFVWFTKVIYHCHGSPSVTMSLP